jgi:hypothetical protein
MEIVKPLLKYNSKMSYDMLVNKSKMLEEIKNKVTCYDIDTLEQSLLEIKYKIEVNPERENHNIEEIKSSLLSIKNGAKQLTNIKHLENEKYLNKCLKMLENRILEIKELIYYFKNIYYCNLYSTPEDLKEIKIKIGNCTKKIDFIKLVFEDFNWNKYDVNSTKKYLVYCEELIEILDLLPDHYYERKIYSIYMVDMCFVMLKNIFEYQKNKYFANETHLVK